MRLGCAKPDTILPHNLARRHLPELPAGEERETMSDRTHAEFMRSILHSPWGPDLPEYRERFDTIADLLDAMQWRKEPPDSVGEWLRRVPGDRTLDAYDITEAMLPMDPSKHIGLLLPGALWFKPPEVTG